MDIESDESERWEDFFGSSTDLTPSLIGLYDSLTDSFNGSHKLIDGTQDTKQNEGSNDTNPIGDRKIELVSVNHSNQHNHQTSGILNGKPRNFQLLSPNVQRLISHSTSTSVEKGDWKQQQQITVQTSSTTNGSNFTSSNVVSRSFRRTTGKQKLSHIPLSKNTCKLTQAGTELVETFDTTILSSTESLDSLQTSTNSKGSDPVVDNDKTPTNVIGGFHFDLDRSQVDSPNQTPADINGSSDPVTNKNVKNSQAVSGIKLDYDNYEKSNVRADSPVNGNSRSNHRQHHLKHQHKQQSEKQPQKQPSERVDFNHSSNRIVEIVRRLQQVAKSPTSEENSFSVKCHSEKPSADVAANPSTINSQLNSSDEMAAVLNKCLDIGESSDEHFEDSVLETCNFYTTAVPESELNQSLDSIVISDNKHATRNDKTQSSGTKLSNAKKPPSPSSPLLTYSRVKSLGGKSSSASRKLSAESLDRLTEMKTKPSSSSPRSNRSPSLILPDIAKLKHRPLSSSSICSTSSSSSSGSDHHIAGKLGISYLASVESLADQSENELLGSNVSLTVFERSCKEIVDSERSYVEDLDQVIRGYLEDWKEGACLKEDELKVLFSNIQDIYDFNLILLKQLMNSGMDPFKIAKCFIDLRDGFNVYTTYCTSYPEAISLLTSLLQASHTNALLTSTQKMLKHTLPLGSYLLKPVQRILKYHLLLDNLRKHCDVQEVAQAHEIMREVARNIDQVKRKLEQQSRVKELSGILDGWLGPELTVLGELRQEGLLLENHKPRMVFLFQTMLIITKPKEDNRLQFKYYIGRSNLMLREHLPGEPTSFNVIPYDEPRNQTKLTAKNRDQKRLWAQNIKGVILEQFDIPSRAKELVYKLGDEEDRTPDKNIWKWSLNSSTPVYLERRNQYRRSEMRNRSKMKRKNMTTSVSLEGFNRQKELENRELQRNQSMDDNMIPSLPKVPETSKESSKKTSAPKSEGKPKGCSHKSELCKCSSVKRELTASLTRSQIKERSKSVPRIPSTANGDSDEDYHMSSENISRNHQNDSRLYKFSTLGRPKSSKQVDVKMYNTKTMPKRIATLKKNKAKKETSRFYMDLSDIEDTVLRITESTDNLTIAEDGKKVDPQNSQQSLELDRQAINQEGKGEELEVEKQVDPETEERNQLKKDFEIISELLKEHKDFDKILKKPPKKRSFDNGLIISSPESAHNQVPPPVPPRSPPPLEVEELKVAKARAAAQEAEEHIYESLLRNVHVPYKFSPVLNRSKSQQYYTSTSKTDPKPKPLPRPESDYVTLVYSESGDLESVENGTPNNNGGEMLRNSDSNINYETVAKCEASEDEASSPSVSFSSVNDLQRQESFTGKSAKNLLQRLVNSKGENVSTSENSLLPRVRKSVDNISMGFGRISKPERRVSDVSEMCRQSIIHKQGSEAVGERMANLDYADPRTLFVGSSVNNSALSLNPQRDSVFSLTSSNDSVCDGHKKSQTSDDIVISSPKRSSFTYEDSVEACLENDFRDSAVYSDDNERRNENFDEIAETSTSPSSPQPPPLPKRHQQPPMAPRKPQAPLPKTANPPPIPAKPHIPLKRLSSTNSNSIGSPEILSPTESDSSGKSWVLQQIENFNK